ncbi:MAG: anaerobic ribonucleoside-triphosphate reductase activating protein [Clostridia bacterium]|nr:anaerobic ribonucleoside-triphosphate reductase activating protein [Clostridia bacterium]MBR4799771.1 anaerobic ribonucleoside-triphosphate reductase activating protein [Clostridia bacterium]MBR5746155.1 anaerobic ribonucleoside-triphosphate reductase activating protein [Clostridia bacterium]
MVLAGLQKLTLLDYPGHMACTVFTHGCNLRCPFCHNAGLVVRENDYIIKTEEFFDFLDKRKGILDGVAITGGEPLLQTDIGGFMAEIKKRGFRVKLDTNGFFPERLKPLLDAGLADYVAMDIKSPREGYAKAVGLSAPDISRVEKSVELLMGGKTDFEFRTTAVKGIHTPEDFKKIGEWIAGDEKYFIQHFTDSGDLIGSGLDAFNEEESAKLLASVLPLVPKAQLRGI